MRGVGSLSSKTEDPPPTLATLPCLKIHCTLCTLHKLRILNIALRHCVHYTLCVWHTVQCTLCDPYTLHIEHSTDCT